MLTVFRTLFGVFLLFNLISVSFVVESRPIVDKRGVGHVVDVVANLFRGTGTFFHPVTEGGAIGSCGPIENDHSRICAMNIKQYGQASKKSPWCFLQLRVKSGGRSTICTVTDCCPGCAEGSLDMTPQVFNDLAHPSVGVIPIEWCIRGYRGCK
ncbi:hypothetical protein INT46_010726 [Mucor plumbeus]|uniref:RlpA-like protein double-psi beta-barrel domain-containing protein n=1 Tax=Mucor plumbeus TaxID=97098 RepID=A0A8H7V798_9FUNG|nr:hypothetical protein INT46_010726 [Mucor plumbeus]